MAKQFLASGAGVKLLNLETRRSGDYLSDVAQFPSEPFALSGLSLTNDFDVRMFSTLGLFRFDSPEVVDEFTDEHVTRLVDWLERCTDLTDLTFQRWKAERVTDEAAAEFARLASLDRIFLSFPHLTDRSVTHLGGLPELNDIWLASPRLTDRVWGEFARIESLKIIRVSAAGSGDHRLLQGHGAAALADHPNLKSLDIEACKWSSEGMSEIAKLTRLEELGFAFVPVTDEDLLRLKSLDGLRSLELFETNVTPDGVAALQAKLPNCRITVPSR